MYYTAASPASVSFTSSGYTVQENTGKVQAEIVLSRPLSTAITITVKTRDGSATGE